MVMYLVKWALGLTMFYSVYGFALRRETFHFFNRLVLWGIVVLSALLPLCIFTIHEPLMVNVGMQNMETLVSTAAVEVVNKGTVATTVVSPISVETIIGCVFAFVAFSLLLRYVFSIIKLVCVLRHSKEVMRLGRVRVLVNESVNSPFSWMCWIVINSKDLSENGEVLLAHEFEHIRQGHSVDMLLIQLVCCALWFCPFVWLLRADLQAVHEFQADAGALNKGITAKDYGYLLVDKVVQTQSVAMANCMNASNLKRRLRMMYANSSSRLHMMKVLFLLPLAALAMITFARPKVVKQIVKAKEVTDFVDYPVSDEVVDVANNEVAMSKKRTNKVEDIDNMLHKKKSLSEIAHSLGVDESVEVGSMVLAKGEAHYAVNNKKVSREEIEKYVVFAPHRTQKGELVMFALKNSDITVIGVSGDAQINKQKYGVDGVVFYVETKELKKVKADTAYE